MHTFHLEREEKCFVSGSTTIVGLFDVYLVVVHSFQ